MADLSQLPSERDITSNQYFEDILVYVHGPTTAETTLVTKLCMIWRPHLLGHPQTIFSWRLIRPNLLGWVVRLPALHSLFHQH